MSSSSSTTPFLGKSKPEHFATGLSGKSTKPRVRQTVNPSSTHGTNLILNPSLVKGGLSISHATTDSAVRLPTYASNINPYLLASTLHTLNKPFRQVAHGGLSFTPTPRSSSSTSSSASSSTSTGITFRPNPKETSTSAASPTPRPPATLFSFGGLPLGNGYSASFLSPPANQISVLPAGASGVTLTTASEDIPFLGNLSSILPSTLLNQQLLAQQNAKSKASDKLQFIQSGSSSAQSRKRKSSSQIVPINLQPSVPKQTITVNLSSKPHTDTSRHFTTHSQVISKSPNGPNGLNTVVSNVTQSSMQNIDIIISSSPSSTQPTTTSSNKCVIPYEERPATVKLITLPSNPVPKVVLNSDLRDVSKLSRSVKNNSVSSFIQEKTNSEPVISKENLVSKLDIREGKLLAKRSLRSLQGESPLLHANSDEDYQAESDESDLSDYECYEEFDYRMTYKCTLTKGPALKPENNPEKDSFLEGVGLISNEHKAQLEFDLQEQRNEYMKDIQVNFSKETIKLLEEAKKGSHNDSQSVLEPSSLLPSDLEIADENEGKQKADFMAGLKLGLEKSASQKHKREVHWVCVLQDKARRKEFNLCYSTLNDNLTPETKKKWLRQIKPKPKAFRMNSDIVPPSKGAVSSHRIYDPIDLKEDTRIIRKDPNKPEPIKGLLVKDTPIRPCMVNMVRPSTNIVRREVPVSYDMSGIEWEGIKDFQRSYVKHLNDQESKRVNLVVMINTLKEIVAEKKKHSEILKKKINDMLSKKKEMVNDEERCLVIYNKLKNMIVNFW